MNDNKSTIILKQQRVEKIFNGFKINLITDSIIISVENNSFNIFKSKYNLEYLHY